MTRQRAALALTLGVAVAFSSGIGLAEPRRSCRMAIDPEGDDRTHTPAVLSTGSLDILSADVASDARFLTTVLRLRDLTDNRGAPSGARYNIAFTLRGNRLITTAFRAPDGVQFELRILLESAGNANASAATYGLIGKIDGVFDEDLSEIRMHVPTATLRPYGGTERRRFEKLGAESAVRVGTTTDPGVLRRGYAGLAIGGDDSGDSVSTATVYIGGQPSCVTPGL